MSKNSKKTGQNPTELAWNHSETGKHVYCNVERDFKKTSVKRPDSHQDVFLRKVMKQSRRSFAKISLLLLWRIDPSILLNLPRNGGTENLWYLKIVSRLGYHKIQLQIEQPLLRVALKLWFFFQFFGVFFLVVVGRNSGGVNLFCATCHNNFPAKVNCSLVGFHMDPTCKIGRICWSSKGFPNLSSLGKGDPADATDQQS